MRLLALTGSLPWLLNNVGFALSVKKRHAKPNLLSNRSIIHKDSDVPIKLSLTEHTETSTFETVLGLELTIISIQKSVDCWTARTLLHWTKFNFQSQNNQPTQKILGDLESWDN